MPGLLQAQVLLLVWQFSHRLPDRVPVAQARSVGQISLRYVGFYGDYSTTPAGAMNVPQSINAVLSDRAHVLLTLKVTI